ncbi:Flp family type IVb pilin [Oceaniglobus trochenteri]|uniref:Flp family type IVb pilin n=1 Tax=Oceaniglobus trochenteri TaxID=2763260 RepID=UPI001CFF7236|nr:hypothetical protein [Oceaniglobus trochenteri]
MRQAIDTFLRDETGATTVDWVLLTAGVMSLTLAVMGMYGNGAEQISSTVSTAIAKPITTTF